MPPWIQKYIDLMNEETRKWFIFSIGFVAGGLPPVAEYSSNTCVQELAPMTLDSIEVYIVVDYIEKTRAAGKKVSFLKYAVLGIYISRLGMQLPVTERECR